MRGKKIVFTEPFKAELQNFTVREPKDNEVVIRVIKTLISNGTEKAYLSHSPNTRGIFPYTPGYSSAGYVVSVGKSVKEFKEGDRVFAEYGGHASYNVKNTSNVIKIPDEVSFEEAAFIKIASYPLLGLRHAKLEMGESVVVVGLGMLGLFGVQIARISGALPVLAVGNREIRQRKALEYGAKFVYSPDDPKLKEKIVAETKITGVGGADIVLETSGSIDALISGLDYATKRGRVALTGCTRVSDKTVDFYKYVHCKGISIIGAHADSRLKSNSAPGNWTAKKDHKTIAGFLADGRLDAKSMITDIVKPDKAPEIYNRLVNDKEFPFGVLFDWN